MKTGDIISVNKQRRRAALFPDEALGICTELDSDWTVYCDGSVLVNPGGPGGWGVVVFQTAIGPASIQRLSGFDPETTNNRMEMTGAIEGLRATPAGSSVLLISDSRYVIYTLTEGWRIKFNHDLWDLFKTEIRLRRVRPEWVKGHDGNTYNEMADRLAGAAARGGK